MKIHAADRIGNLPPYIFSEISRWRAQAEQCGSAVLSLAIGDPDLPTPKVIIDKIKEASENCTNHGYSPYEGSLGFRMAVSRWFAGRFNVILHPEREIVALIGSKEGIAHFPWAICNPGDVGLYPSPGYPVFLTSIGLSGATPIPIPLRSTNGFLPDRKELDALMAKYHPKLMVLNFPSNPTSAVCPKEIFSEMIALALKHNVIVAHDNTYSEIYFDPKHRPPSILEVPGAKECAIEFHSLSKTFNMTGWRIGFAVGNEKLVSTLLRLKTNIDSGPLLTVQEAACFALDHAEEIVPGVVKPYEERIEILVKGFKNLGIEYLPPSATFFVWARLPNGLTSMDFCKRLIQSRGLLVLPGIGFGREGEGFFRLALTVPNQQIEEALGRLAAFLKKG